MSNREWSDKIAGDRMAVDQEFASTVENSQFSRQQWGLIMTAVEFEVERPDDPEEARLVADTGNVETIVPELEKMEQRGGMVGAGGSGGSGGGGGIVDSIKDALGVGGGASREQLAAAEEMAQMYADDLQSKLEARGKWERVRTAASNDATRS